MRRPTACVSRRLDTEAAERERADVLLRRKIGLIQPVGCTHCWAAALDMAF
jgi:hypothetical protein